MNQLSNILKNRWTAIGLVLVGFAIVVMVVKSGKGPVHESMGERAVNVAYINAENTQVEPRIVGHGVVQPETQYQAITEVSGTLIFVSDKLKDGSLLDKGTLIAEIDATDYILTLEQAEASRISALSQIKELELQEKSLKENYELLKERLTITEQELERKNKLYKRGSLSRSALDSEKHNVLQLRLELVNQEEAIAILPSNIALAQAELRSAEANIKQQQRNIERTKFYMPFLGRVNAVDAEEDQYVSTGKALFFADAIEKIEISAQFPINRMREFLTVATRSTMASNPLFFDEHNSEMNAQRMQNFIELLGLSARVHLNVAGDFSWSATVVSIGESVNMATQTVSVLVEVVKPYRNIKPSTKPPLLKGMQVSVDLISKAQSGVLLPRHTLHKKGLYSIAQDKLLILPVKPDLMMDNWLLFSPKNLAENSQIITSDMSSPLPGRKVKGMFDEELQQKTRSMVTLSLQGGE